MDRLHIWCIVLQCTAMHTWVSADGTPLGQLMGTAPVIRGLCVLVGWL